MQAVRPELVEACVEPVEVGGRPLVWFEKVTTNGLNYGPTKTARLS